MQHYIIFSALLLILTVSASEHERPLVKTTQGTVRGYYKQSYGGRTYSAFEGIPFAKPPIGDLRFKEPKTAEPWNGIWDATTKYECIQMAIFTHNVVGNEDCLYLNVYVPNDKPTSKENLDVVVFIHGGGFMMGSPEIGVPAYVMDRDVIYVNFNYRLNILGFLSTEDEVVPGNNGLKDQTLALKWVQKNIKSFGGNPDSVTIVGQSAGGASVHYHYLSPLSKGLFHRGFSQSGTATCPWAFQGGALEKAKKLAALLGCSAQSTKIMIDCMKQRSAKQLIENLKNFIEYNEYPIAPFGPVVEKITETTFLSDHPYKLLSNGQINDVPWITSATTEEGLMFLISLHDKLDDLDEHWNEVLPYILEYTYTVSNSDKIVTAQKIKEFHFGQEKLSHDNLQTLVKLFGDRYFILPFEEASRIQAKVAKSPVYSYLYNYSGEQDFHQKFGLDIKGVTHGDDTNLFLPMGTDWLSGKPLTLEKLSESDEAIKEFFLDMITAFAKNGKPEVQGISWKPVTAGDQFDYLFIEEPSGIKMASKIELAPTEFWQSLPIKERGDTVVVKDEL